ncbi:GDSL-type esterase/lipase family protein [Pseudonocardia kunmingensis]|uniref:Lysophospholipase L1-like esterase n=1 Tax=Pseudonocardia kunmingensis TaxID=630975 RepID=A0A543DA97_9PSEU|nr:GDSL-type esterase/lipase family protein [Pseudonocardia kunmingensis]TQM06252.1 lysophospholipase L1-like esterase [Pseudonocardia kunmingensis]
MGRASRHGHVQAAGWLPSGLAVLVALACAVGLAVATGGAARPPAAAPGVDACGPRWVAGWQAAAEAGPRPEGLGGATVRMVVDPQVTGSQVRLRLSNAYGTTPLAVGAATAARSDGAAGMVAGSGRPVAFGGQQSVVIPPGGHVMSDPVPLVAEVGRPLAVSLFLPVVPEVLTQHSVALRDTYLSGRGDATFADASAFPAVLPSWPVLSGVEVRVPRAVNAVVAVGDSITDGVGAASGQRWTDVLSARIADTGGAATMAVLNAGISGNRLLPDDGPRHGEPVTDRLDRDVLTVAGATDVVLHVGTNDIATGRGAEELVAGLRLVAERARSAGKRVFLTTVTPSTTGPRGTPGGLAAREEVNAWVRAHGREHADGVFDFAAAVADPADPSRLAPPYDAGDGLHLSAAGYRALAAAVDPTLLTGSPCLSGDPAARVVVAGR